MKRATMVLLVVALAPLLMGGGGSPPPGPLSASQMITGPTVEGIFVMDPHEDAMITTLARHGSILLRHKRLAQPEKVAAAVFTIPSGFQLLKGCDTSFTTLRFVNTPNRTNALKTFIAEAGIIRPLFADLGITVPPTMTPVITKVKKQGCTTGGAVPGIPDPLGGVGKGMFWMIVEIKMQVERP